MAAFGQTARPVAEQAPPQEQPAAAPTVEQQGQQQQVESKPTETEKPPVYIDGKKVEEPLWPNCDTVEEIIDEMKYGPETTSSDTTKPAADGSDPAAAAAEEDQSAAVEPEHIALAIRAFAYGTVLAFVGVGLIGLIMMKSAGFSNVKEVCAWVGNRDRRRVEEMRQEGADVVEMTLDLTQPTTVPDQLSDLWGQIMQLSGVQDELDKAVAEAAAEAGGGEEEEKKVEEKK